LQDVFGSPADSTMDLMGDGAAGGDRLADTDLRGGDLEVTTPLASYWYRRNGTPFSMIDERRPFLSGT
jgi:hypothetical protein